MQSERRQAPLLAGARTSGSRAALLERFERATELPLLVLAVAMLPLLVLPLLVDLPSGVDTTFTAVDWLIWSLFAFEYVVRLSLTDARWQFVRREWVSLLIIVLPFLRPLRVVRSARALRLLQLTRLVGFLGRSGQSARRLLVRHQLHYVLVVIGVVIVGCAAAVFAFEDGSDSSIDSFGDALWWAATTVTTVGYGDTFPVTPAGRGVAVFLMLSGIALFGVLTANLAAFLLERGPESEEPEAPSPTDQRLDEVLARLAELERAVSALAVSNGDDHQLRPTVRAGTPDRAAHSRRQG